MYTRRTTIRAVITITLLTLVAYATLLAADTDKATPLVIRPDITTTVTVPQVVDTSTTSSTSTTVVTYTPQVTTPLSDCDTLKAALFSAGGTEQEVAFAITIATRESHCRLKAYNGDSSTGDNSWGPFQLNFYTADTRRAWQRAGILSGESNVVSYPQAASNFLAAYRMYGACPWTAPEYCD